MTSYSSRPPGARPAIGSGTFDLSSDLPVHRLGFGAMRLTGPGVWGEPSDPDEAKAVLRRAIEFGITLIDTADSYVRRSPSGSSPRHSFRTPATS